MPRGNQFIGRPCQSDKSATEYTSRKTRKKYIVEPIENGYVVSGGVYFLMFASSRAEALSLIELADY